MKKILFSILGLMLIIGCDKNEEDGSLCTAIYKMISVNIKDQNQKPVSLDSYRVTTVKGKEDVTIVHSKFEQDWHRKSGSYPILGDSSIKRDEEIQVRFRGFIKNEVVVDEIYTIFHNGCHIDLAFGKINVQIER